MEYMFSSQWSHKSWQNWNNKTKILFFNYDLNWQGELKLAKDEEQWVNTW